MDTVDDDGYEMKQSVRPSAQALEPAFAVDGSGWFAHAFLIFFLLSSGANRTQ
jgi:hypothetical protein